jgi:hypothetical protein
MRSVSLAAEDTKASTALVVAIIALAGTVVTAVLTFVSAHRTNAAAWFKEKRDEYKALLTAAEWVRPDRDPSDDQLNTYLDALNAVNEIGASSVWEKIEALELARKRGDNQAYDQLLKETRAAARNNARPSRLFRWVAKDT